MSDLLRKYGKMMNKVRGTWFDKKGKKSDGVIDEGEAFGLMKLAKPIGAIGAPAPGSNREATLIHKAISAIKTRNAIILVHNLRA
ncbi:hypothetical protein [Oceanispirochaeta sp.]|uniref:hypothetical protein n=1 Tax=Oceanispirochaeta sp. TaxID=2035350 RepID=UPI0026304592|nr:hypothetical protein [Oceanispirochaeta sp.]MDA3955796.1 hypothetical protein [Oceanispirochaeta sp.]